ncbi:hypothetical protein [Herbiconiux sp. L3-i23]|uniref:hypothetical protein n=1 Tax=Herbiconiux sp. L3-i23 TaxID=2905871 RepID=UPI00205E2DFE|nr:hypothetical protein [Herbiconiux sp. L3-i23]BDI21819.1 hypothetical protein L3i23_05950 [Herbiconiux sp. L3-i23]
MSVSRDQLTADLLALNSDDVPFAFAAFDGGVVGVWDYADAKWAGFLSAGKIDRDYELTVNLYDDGTYTLIDRTKDTETRIDRKGFHYESNSFRGNTRKISFNKSFAPVASDHGQVGNTYGWKFDTEEMKQPVREVLQRDGWTERKRSFLDKVLGRG